MRPAGDMLAAALVLLLLCVATSETDLSILKSTEIVFDISSLYPIQLKPFLTEIYLNKTEALRAIDAILQNGTDGSTAYLQGSITWLSKHKPELNASATLKMFVASSEFDSITKAKLKEFTSELIEADLYNTEYHVGRFLFNYLRFRQSFGKARSIIRHYYPALEAFAKVKEIRDFYYQYRGHNPDDLFMLEAFVELINWLLEQGQLPMIKFKTSYEEATGKQVATQTP